MAKSTRTRPRTSLRFPTPTPTPTPSPTRSVAPVDPGSVPDECRLQIDQLAHKLLDPSLGRERASFVAVNIWLWLIERRAAAPTFLDTPEEFDRGVRRKMKDEVRKIRHEAAKYDDSEDIDVLCVERRGGEPTGALAPDEALIQAETIWHVQRAIAQLPPRMQRVVRLCGLKEWSGEEAAIELGMTPATVRALQSRARAKLRELLGHYEDLLAA